MADIIKHKRSADTGEVPGVGELLVGELAMNTTDGKLFTEKADSSTVFRWSNDAAAAITGGTINGATVGATTAASGRFTTITGTDTTASTSSTTGALITAGGAGIAKDSHINSLRIGQGADGTNITVVGVSTGSQLTAAADGCTFVGNQAGFWNSSGDGNTALGYNAAVNVRTGSWNSAFGIQSLYTNQSGSHNVAVGLEGLYSATHSFNSSFGSTAGYALTGATSQNNVVIGYAAARFHSDGTTALTTSASSVYIGSQCRGLNNSDSNTIVIGASAIADGANTTVIGTTSTTQCRLRAANLLSTNGNGQSTQFGQATTTLSTPSGTTATATNLIPANSLVLGVTCRVITAITGATSFNIGDGTTANKFGNAVGISLGTTSQNILVPSVYAAATSVVLTRNGSNFTGGQVRLTVHYMTLIAPTS